MVVLLDAGQPHARCWMALRGTSGRSACQRGAVRPSTVWLRSCWSPPTAVRSSLPTWTTSWLEDSPQTKSATTAGTVDPIPRKRYLDDRYAARTTIRHSNAVLRVFYSWSGESLTTATVERVGDRGFWVMPVGEPRFHDSPREDLRELGTGRCIGEVVCHVCNNVMARLFDPSPRGTFLSRGQTGGFELFAWMPNPQGDPLYPPSDGLGKLWYTRVDDAFPADDRGSTLRCWRGHQDMWISGRDCRAMISRYLSKGRVIRHPARPKTREDREIWPGDFEPPLVQSE